MIFGEEVVEVSALAEPCERTAARRRPIVVVAEHMCTLPDWTHAAYRAYVDAVVDAA